MRQKIRTLDEDDVSVGPITNYSLFGYITIYYLYPFIFFYGIFLLREILFFIETREILFEKMILLLLCNIN